MGRRKQRKRHDKKFSWETFRRKGLQSDKTTWWTKSLERIENKKIKIGTIGMNFSEKGIKKKFFKIVKLMVKKPKIIPIIPNPEVI